ncbi:hypothetical protein AG1IA_07202 [Rhizoctonia solani AG-1 IA]|uniref:Uncharacterized protein n=1 Tax=Thanatephorus cucumeris (strain AG1-IA) TaxID=983506 RepID=L8WKS1_THACA|nr:hypothetical protein AG1IA_07202 [Rhizoctonia solani AG-1 IA]
MAEWVYSGWMSGFLFKIKNNTSRQSVEVRYRSKPRLKETLVYVKIKKIPQLVGIQLRISRYDNTVRSRVGYQRSVGVSMTNEPVYHCISAILHALDYDPSPTRFRHTRTLPKAAS